MGWCEGVMGWCEGVMEWDGGDHYECCMTMLYDYGCVTWLLRLLGLIRLVPLRECESESVRV
jgi:hypothetical protein